MKNQILEKLREKFIGCILGSAVGDALGAPYEGRRGSRIPLKVGIPAEYGQIRGYPKGQYTDDTQMSLAIIRAIIKTGKVDGEAIAREFIPLWKNGEIIGAGMSCTEAINRLIRGEADWKTAGTGRGRAGNGSAMRVAPVGLWDYNKPEHLVEDAAISSIITHHDERCTAGAVCVAYMVAYAIKAESINAEEIIELLNEEVNEIHKGFAEEISRLSRWLSIAEGEAIKEIRKAGNPALRYLGGWPGISPYVIPTVLITLFFFLKYPTSYEDNLIRVIKVGGDVDSTAAIMGAIAGAYNGFSSIPARLIKGLKDSQQIQKLAEDFFHKKISS